MTRKTIPSLPPGTGPAQATVGASPGRLYRMIPFVVRQGRCGGALTQFQPGVTGGNALPFRIGKVLTMWGMRPDDVRGMHAHYRTEEIIVALRGGCTFDLDDGRGTRAVVRLRTATGRGGKTVPALLLYPRVWRTFRLFLPDTLLLVVANMHYDERDYLRDRSEFERRARRWRGLGGSYGRGTRDDTSSSWGPGGGCP